MSHNPSNNSNNLNNSNNSNSSGNGEEQCDRNSLFSMTDLLKLPEAERKLMTWIVQQHDVSLAEAIDYMKQEDETVWNMLNSLCDLGFLEEFDVEGEKYFRCYLPSKKSTELPQKIWRNLDF